MKAILPGSYDPITLGHLEIIKKANEKYDEIFVVAFVNPDKKYFFSEEERVEMIRLATADIGKVRVDFSSGRVVDYMKENGIEKIVKGYRNEVDLEYERIQSEYNFANGGYETEFLECSPEHREISSTLAREIILSDEDLSKVLPIEVVKYLKNKKSLI